jgi:hypothetical protein
LKDRPINIVFSLYGEEDLVCCLWTVRREVNGIKVWAVLFPKHLVKYVEEFVLCDVTPCRPLKNQPTIRRNMSLPFSGSKNK